MLPTPGNDQAATDADRIRRQQILRMGLLMCLFFIFLDGGRDAPAQEAALQRARAIQRDEITLPLDYATKLSAVLQDGKGIDYRGINVTGLYRGITEHQMSTNSSSGRPGTALVQLKSLPVRGVPEISFVYGVLRIYDRGTSQIASSGLADVSIPLQGAVIASTKQLILFSTPLKTQRLMLQIIEPRQAAASAAVPVAAAHPVSAAVSAAVSNPQAATALSSLAPSSSYSQSAAPASPASSTAAVPSHSLPLSSGSDSVESAAAVGKVAGISEGSRVDRDPPSRQNRMLSTASRDEGNEIIHYFAQFEETWAIDTEEEAQEGQEGRYSGVRGFVNGPRTHADLIAAASAERYDDLQLLSPMGHIAISLLFKWGLLSSFPSSVPSSAATIVTATAGASAAVAVGGYAFPPSVFSFFSFLTYLSSFTLNGALSFLHESARASWDDSGSVIAAAARLETEPERHDDSHSNLPVLSMDQGLLEHHQYQQQGQQQGQHQQQHMEHSARSTARRALIGALTSQQQESQESQESLESPIAVQRYHRSSGAEDTNIIRRSRSVLDGTVRETQKGSEKGGEKGSERAGRVAGRVGWGAGREGGAVNKSRRGARQATASNPLVPSTHSYDNSNGSGNSGGSSRRGVAGLRRGDHNNSVVWSPNGFPSNGSLSNGSPSSTATTAKTGTASVGEKEGGLEVGADNTETTTATVSTTIGGKMTMLRIAVVDAQSAMNGTYRLEGDKPLSSSSSSSSSNNSSSDSRDSGGESGSSKSRYIVGAWDASIITSRDYVMYSAPIGEAMLSARFKYLQSTFPVGATVACPVELDLTLQTNINMYLSPAAAAAPSPSSSTTSSTSLSLSLFDNAAAGSSSSGKGNGSNDRSKGERGGRIDAEAVAGHGAGRGTRGVLSTSRRRVSAQEGSSSIFDPDELAVVKSASGYIRSRECGKSLQIKMTSFQLQFEQLRSKVEVYSLIMAFISIAQILLVIHQLKQCQTQAVSTKMSILGVFAQSILDAVICMAHLLLGTAVPNIFFSSFIWITILKLLLFSVFQMRLIINIYQARYAQEIASEGWQGLRRRMINMHLRFYIAVLFVLVVSFGFPNRPILAILILYSSWLPQIVFSAYSGTKLPFPLYMVGTSLSRLFLPLYILGCPKNFLVLLTEYISPSATFTVASSSTACYVLILWTAFQVAVQLMQNIYGARFFIPKSWLPAKYNYKRPIPVHLLQSSGNNNNNDNNSSSDSSSGGSAGDRTGSSSTSSSLSAVGGTLARRSVGASSININSISNNNNNNNNSSGSNSSANDSFPNTDGGADLEAGAVTPLLQQNPDDDQQGCECVICYNAVSVLPHTSDYMITPCDHLFHEVCLERWMDIKLECPVCRATLPAIDES